MKGPCSGGTELTIFGKDLNVGKNVSVKVAGNECVMKSRWSIVCFTEQLLIMGSFYRHFMLSTNCIIYVSPLLFFVYNYWRWVMSFHTSIGKTNLYFALFTRSYLKLILIRISTVWYLALSVNSLSPVSKAVFPKLAKFCKLFNHTS